MISVGLANTQQQVGFVVGKENDKQLKSEDQKVAGVAGLLKELALSKPKPFKERLAEAGSRIQSDLKRVSKKVEITYDELANLEAVDPPNMSAIIKIEASRDALEDLHSYLDDANNMHQMLTEQESKQTKRIEKFNREWKGKEGDVPEEKKHYLAEVLEELRGDYCACVKQLKSFKKFAVHKGYEKERMLLESGYTRYFDAVKGFCNRLCNLEDDLVEMPFEVNLQQLEMDRLIDETAIEDIDTDLTEKKTKGATEAALLELYQGKEKHTRELLQTLRIQKKVLIGKQRAHGAKHDALKKRYDELQNLPEEEKARALEKLEADKIPIFAEGIKRQQEIENLNREIKRCKKALRKAQKKVASMPGLPPLKGGIVGSSASAVVYPALSLSQQEGPLAVIRQNLDQIVGDRLQDLQAFARTLQNNQTALANLISQEGTFPVDQIPEAFALSEQLRKRQAVIQERIQAHQIAQMILESYN